MRDPNRIGRDEGIVDNLAGRSVLSIVASDCALDLWDQADIDSRNLSQRSARQKTYSLLTQSDGAVAWE